MTEDEVKESNPCGTGMDGCHCDSRMCRVSKGVWDLHGDGDSSFRWQDQTGGALKDDPPVLSPSQRRRRLQCLYLETSLQKRFEERYGTEQELLESLQRELGFCYTEQWDRVSKPDTIAPITMSTQSWSASMPFRRPCPGAVRCLPQGLRHEIPLAL